MSQLSLLGADRLLLHPDFGFATFADNPIASARIAEQKLGAIAKASAMPVIVCCVVDE